MVFWVLYCVRVSWWRGPLIGAGGLVAVIVFVVAVFVVIGCGRLWCCRFLVFCVFVLYSRYVFRWCFFSCAFFWRHHNHEPQLQHHLRYRLRVIHGCVGGGCDLLLPSNQAPTTTHQQYQRPHHHHTHPTPTTFTSTTKHKPPTTHQTQNHVH